MMSKVVVEYPVFCPECGEIHKSRVSTVTVEIERMSEDYV